MAGAEGFALLDDSQPQTMQTCIVWASGPGIASMAIPYRLRLLRCAVLKASFCARARSAESHHKSRKYPRTKASGDIFLAGAEGFEPPNAWTKTMCLTTWPRPNISLRYLEMPPADKVLVTDYCSLTRASRSNIHVPYHLATPQYAEASIPDLLPWR